LWLVLLGALGERMLRLAGRRASGTILWMTGPRTIATHVTPTITEAAREAGRPAPRIVAGVNLVLTRRVDVAMDKLGRLFSTYRTLPSYRAMIEREGSDDVRDYVIVGDEAAIDAGLARLRDAGVTDLEAYVGRGEPGDEDRAFELLADRARSGSPPG
jgi:alkanesulfonate monooxygenase SsuD/methylene tetrahydromethanopterin reductase-like flavin-dependent oxidoreductase (luciferase family)